VFGDAAGRDGMPGWDMPYFATGAHQYDEGTTYADDGARLANASTFEWMHPLGAVTEALIGAGLRLEWLREHPRVPWRMFRCLVPDGEGLYRWSDQPWLPLAYSLRATRPR